MNLEQYEESELGGRLAVVHAAAVIVAGRDWTYQAAVAEAFKIFDEVVRVEADRLKHDFELKPGTRETCDVCGKVKKWRFHR